MVGGARFVAAMNIVFGVLKDNHVATWAATMESLARDYPGLSFGKAIVIGGRNSVNEFNTIHPLLKQYFYKSCEFTSEIHDWDNGSTEVKFNYLQKLRDALQTNKTDTDDLYLINSSGSLGQQEHILLLGRVLGAKIFDCFERTLEGRYGTAPVEAYTPSDGCYVPNNLFEIPAEHVDRMVSHMIASNNGDLEVFEKLFSRDITNNYPSDDFISSLASKDLRYCEPLNYPRRWRNLGVGYDQRKSQFVDLERKGRDILETVFRTTEFVVEPKISSRVKEKTSLWNKLLMKEAKKGYIEDPFTRFTDIVGFRVEFSNQKDMDRGIHILKTSGDFVNGDGKTEISVDPRNKRLGYRADHLDVKLHPDSHNRPNPALPNIVFEIQFKTSLASTWSELHHRIIYKAEQGGSLSDARIEELNASFMKAAVLLEHADLELKQICEDFNI